MQPTRKEPGGNRKSEQRINDMKIEEEIKSVPSKRRLGFSAELYKTFKLLLSILIKFAENLRGGNTSELTV